VTLIIVIFAMMILGILGWTLAVMLTGDFQANLRSLNSEKALYFAEAGKEWAFRQLILNSTWRTSSDTDCNHTSEWLLHNLTGGQYEVCCRGNQTGENATTIIESSGYVPAKTNYLAMRKIKFLVNSGGFRYVVQTKDLFDWSAVTKTAGDSYFNGYIQAGHYNGDGDFVYDEAGVDYRTPPNELPADNNALNQDRLLASQPYPGIDMDYYYQQAQAQGASRVWPRYWVANEAQIISKTANRLTVNPAIFNWTGGGGSNQWEDNIVRNMAAGRGWQDNDWRIILDWVDSATIQVSNTTGWNVTDTIRIGRHFTSDQGNSGQSTLYYVRGDALIDVRDHHDGGGEDITFRRVGLITEGDIVIKGPYKLWVTDRVRGTDIWPALGTENGNIISTDTPSGHDNSDRRGQRDFDNAIYTKNGAIDWNYLSGEAVIGNQITFHNSIRLTYDGRDNGYNGFGWGVAKRDWQEQ
jgi:hypothetical protein